MVNKLISLLVLCILSISSVEAAADLDVILTEYYSLKEFTQLEDCPKWKTILKYRNKEIRSIIRHQILDNNNNVRLRTIKPLEDVLEFVE